MEDKKIVAVIRESVLLELQDEIPELFDNEKVIVKVLEDHMFDVFIDVAKQQEKNSLPEK